MTEGERSILQHWSRWGSDGYPIHKRGRLWFWDEMYGVKGCPAPFKTKREAFAAYERYIKILIDKSANRD